MKEYAQMIEEHSRKRNKSLVLEQMNYVEQQIERGTNFLINRYSERLSKLEPNASTKPRDYGCFITYEQSIERVTVLIRNMFRNAARENHMADKTEIEFQHYLQNKLQILRENVIRWFQSSYNDYVIPLKDVLEDLSDVWPQMEETFRTSFEGMRQISKRIDSEIETERHAFEEKYARFLDELRDTILGLNDYKSMKTKKENDN
jgi:hypothetical protein